LDPDKSFKPKSKAKGASRAKSESEFERFDQPTDASAQSFSAHGVAHEPCGDAITVVAGLRRIVPGSLTGPREAWRRGSNLVRDCSSYRPESPRNRFGTSPEGLVVSALFSTRFALPSSQGALNSSIDMRFGMSISERLFARMLFRPSNSCTARGGPIVAPCQRHLQWHDSRPTTFTLSKRHLRWQTSKRLSANQQKNNVSITSAPLPIRYTVVISGSCLLWQRMRNVIAGHSWCKGEGRLLALEADPQSF